MMRTNILPRSSSASSLFSFSLLLLLQHAIFHSFVVTKVEGNECRLVMEKNEWAAGCIPAVNFVVKCKSWVFLLAIVYTFNYSVSYFSQASFTTCAISILWYYLTISGRLWRCSNVRFFPHLNQRRNIYTIIWFSHIISKSHHYLLLYIYILCFIIIFVHYIGMI